LSVRGAAGSIRLPGRVRPAEAGDSADPAAAAAVLAGPAVVEDSAGQAGAAAALPDPVAAVAAAADRLREEDKFISHKQKPWIGVNTYRGFYFCTKH